jgi:hypothetical protein
MTQEQYIARLGDSLSCFVALLLGFMSLSMPVITELKIKRLKTAKTKTKNTMNSEQVRFDFDIEEQDRWYTTSMLHYTSHLLKSP